MTKKAITIIMVSIVVVIVSMVFTSILLNKEDKSINDNEIKILTETNPTDIIILGNDIDFGGTLPYRKIDTISEDEIGEIGAYKFKLLIINDRQNNLDISLEQLELIKNLADNTPMNFFYFGTQYLDEIKEVGMRGTISVTSGAKEMGAVYAQDVLPGHMTSYLGFWTSVEEEHLKENTTLQGQIIINTMVHIIKNVNKQYDYYE